MGLAHAERELGLDSRTLVLDEPPKGFEADQLLFPRGTGRLTREWRRWRFALRELRSFDVVHFNFGSTLMPTRHPDSHPALRLYAALVEGGDLRWLPKRIAVFVTYQGDDARQAHHRFAALPPGYFDPRVDATKRRAIERFTRRADGIFAVNPDLLEVLPPNARFLPYASVDLREWQPVAPRADRTPLVVHAPSNRAVKGTEHVVRGVERLRGEGMHVDLFLVEGATRAEARAAYARADIVVDQLLIGWYGGMAVEAMALARPVIAHIAQDDLARVPSKLARDLPIVRATADSFEDVLRATLTQPRGALAALGRQGRVFVEQWHDPLTIARKTRDAYLTAVRSRR